MGAKTLLAIGAHADDIEMSMGGATLKYHERFGYEVRYVMTTNNMSGGWLERDGQGGVRERKVSWREEMPQRKLEADTAARELFQTEVLHLDHPQRHYKDEQLRTLEVRYGSARPEGVPEDVPTILTACEDKAAIGRMAELILAQDPEVVLTLSLSDANLEHGATALLVWRAFQKARQGGYDGTLLFSLTPAPSDLPPFYNRYDTFVDTTGFHKRKLQAIGYHACQKPYPERLDLRDFNEGLRCGCETAEPYLLAEEARVRTGEFTRELIANHRYCVKHWRRMFFLR